MTGPPTTRKEAADPHEAGHRRVVVLSFGVPVVDASTSTLRCMGAAHPSPPLRTSCRSSKLPIALPGSRRRPSTSSQSKEGVL